MKQRFTHHGAFSWAELMTNDLEGAKQFYGELLGWQVADTPLADGGSYSVIDAGGEKVGGMMTIPEEVQEIPSHWGSYVTVDDVDARAIRAEELGAKLIVPPTDIPGIGRFSIFQDPQGAVLSIITYLPLE